MAAALHQPVSRACSALTADRGNTTHVGSRPGGRLLGLARLARVGEHFVRRPQDRERLPQQIADWPRTHLEPHDVGVVIDAERACVTPRDVQATGSMTTTSARLGLLRSDSRSRSGFLP
ncbi:GTP cyclohydrolase I [Streptomyces sennicomposti]